MKLRTALSSVLVLGSLGCSHHSKPGAGVAMRVPGNSNAAAQEELKASVLTQPGSPIITIALSDGRSYSIDTTRLVDVDQGFKEVTDPPADRPMDLKVISTALSGTSYFLARLASGLSDAQAKAYLASVGILKPIKIQYQGEDGAIWVTGAAEGGRILASVDLTEFSNGSLMADDFSAAHSISGTPPAEQLFPALAAPDAYRAESLFFPSSVQGLSKSKLERVIVRSPELGMGPFDFFWHSNSVDRSYFIRSDGVVFKLASPDEVQSLTKPPRGMGVRMVRVGKL